MRDSMPRGMTKRQFLRNSIVFGSASAVLPSLGGTEAAFADTQKEWRRVIYLWGCGGVASTDTFDPKMHSSAVKMLFEPISTSVEGVQFTDQFPQLATLLHHLVLFRARYNADLDHVTAIAKSLGRKREDGTHLLTRISDQTSARRYVYAETPKVIK